MQIVFNGDNLHETSNPNDNNLHEMSNSVFWEKQEIQICYLLKILPRVLSINIEWLKCKKIQGVCADVTGYQYTYLILHAYSDAFE